MTAEQHTSDGPAHEPARPVVTSLTNERVKRAHKLARRKERVATGRFLAEGHKVVEELLADGLVDELFVTEDHADAYAEAGVGLTLVSPEVMERLADARTPQGVVAVARMLAPGLEDVVGEGVLVVLHGVADPGNVGTIIRTADAAGCRGVVLTEGSVDPYNPKAVRASAGSLSHLPVVTSATWPALRHRLRAARQPVYALDTSGEPSLDPLTSRGAAPIALLFGSEAHGLPTDIVGDCEGTVAIPVLGRAESLNLAAAAAVSIYAAVLGRS